MFRSLRKMFNFTQKNNTGTGDNSGNASVRHQLWDRDLGKVHNAAAEGDLVRLEKLLTKKKKDINKLDKKRRTALQIACAAGHDRVVEFLVDRNAALNLCDDTNQSALMKAVQGGHLMCVEILLVYDADVTLKDISGDTALHMAAGTSCVKTAELLLKHGAEINAPNVDGHTPLSVALHHDHTEMVKFLLERGADANATEKCTEMSALMKAAQRGQHHMLQLLLAYGADVLQQNCKGWSAKDYAVKEQHQACAQLLIKHAERSCDGASNLQHRGQHETGTSNNAESVLKAPRMPMSQEEESEHPLSTALNHRTSEGPSLNKSAEALVQEENLIQAMLDDYDLDYEADDSENFTSETASEQPHVSTSQDKINTNDENDGEQYEPDQQTSPSEAAEASVELNTTPSLPEDLPTTSVPSKPCKTSEPSNKHEIREKQKLEVNSQKLRILTDTINQQEDHREILKLLEQERSARALQEDQLNFLLCKQQEIEAENKQNINKCNEALSELSNARDRESQLLQQTVTLQRKIEDLEHIQGTGTLKERQLQEENEQLSRELHVQKELASELDRDLQAQKELVNKHNTTEEILAQVDRENQSLRRQLEEVQKQRDAEQRAMANAQQHFSDMMFKLRTDCDEKVQLVEERNKDLLSKARDLQDQVYTLEKKLKNDGKLRQLQQELSQTLTELSKKEVALDSKTRQCTVLENEKTRVLRKVDGLKEQMAQSEDQCLKIERRYNSLKSSFEEEECAIATQRLQETLSTSAASAATIKDLEEAVQRLEIQNVQLEKSAQQQSFKMETLEREAQKAAEVRAHLQKLVFNLQSSKLSLEEQLSRKELELEKQKVAVDPRLEQEMTRTSDLQAEVHRLHTLVKKKQLQDNDVRGEKIKDLEVQLDRETQRCHQLQKDNSDLHEKQTSLKCSLQKSQEEVQDLRTRMEAAQRECRLVEERTREKMDTIVQEINYHIRIQAAKWEAEFSQKIRELESLVSMARSREQDCLCQLDSILAELEMYKSTYSEEFHRPVTLSETNICLSEVSISTLRRERNMDRAQDKASPSQSLGNSGLNQSPGIPQHSPAMPGQSRGTEDFLTQMRRELDRSIDVELRRSTVNLEMPTDHLSPIDRTMREYRQVLQKNYQI